MCDLCELSKQVIARCEIEAKENPNYSVRKKAQLYKKKAQIVLEAKQEQHSEEEANCNLRLFPETS